MPAQGTTKPTSQGEPAVKFLRETHGDNDISGGFGVYAQPLREIYHRWCLVDRPRVDLRVQIESLVGPENAQATEHHNSQGNGVEPMSNPDHQGVEIEFLCRTLMCHVADLLAMTPAFMYCHIKIDRPRDTRMPV